MSKKNNFKYMSEFIRIANDFGEYSARNKYCKYCHFKGHRMKYCPFGLDNARDSHAYFFWFQFCNEYHRKDTELKCMNSLHIQQARILKKIKNSFVFLSKHQSKTNAKYISTKNEIIKNGCVLSHYQ